MSESGIEKRDPWSGAQLAGEAAYEELINEENACTCQTCVVRVILEASFQYLRTCVVEDAGDSG